MQKSTQTNEGELVMKELFEALIQYVRRGDERIGNPRTLTEAENAIGVIPYALNDCFQPASLEQFKKAPARKRVNLDFAETDSFIEYVNEQKEPETRIFSLVCNPPNYAITAVIDYHGQGVGDPQRMEHQATLKLRATDEWGTWRNLNKKGMTQSEFAIFLEDHQPEIVDPSGSDILEIASTMEATKEVSFRSSLRLDNGTTKFKFDEDMSATAGVTGELEIPNEFTISVPIFQGEKPRNVLARFRYSLRSGNLTFRYELIRPKEEERKTVDNLSKRIREKTKIPVFIMGTAV